MLARALLEKSKKLIAARLHHSPLAAFPELCSLPAECIIYIDLLSSFGCTLRFDFLIKSSHVLCFTLQPLFRAATYFERQAAGTNGYKYFTVIGRSGTGLTYAYVCPLRSQLSLARALATDRVPVRVRPRQSMRSPRGELFIESFRQTFGAYHSALVVSKVVFRIVGCLMLLDPTQILSLLFSSI